MVLISTIFGRKRSRGPDLFFQKRFRHWKEFRADENRDERKNKTKQNKTKRTKEWTKKFTSVDGQKAATKLKHKWNEIETKIQENQNEIDTDAAAPGAAASAAASRETTVKVVANQ